MTVYLSTSNRVSKERGLPILLRLVLPLIFLNNEIVQSLSLGIESGNNTALNQKPVIQKVGSSRNLELAPYFQNWKIWDHPEDQIAVESSISSKDSRKGKQQIGPISSDNGGFEEFRNGPKSVTHPESKESGVQKRSDCNNANTHVSVLPIILAIISIITGIIGIIVLWFVIKGWVDAEHFMSGSVYGGGSSQQYNSGGWNQRSYDGFGFARNLKNLDWNQLTQMVLKGVESYGNIFEGLKPKA